MEIQQHCSTEQLADFLEGRMDPSSRNELSLHLETGCQNCNASFTFYERMFTAIQSLQWPAPTHSVRKRVISQFSLYYPPKRKPMPKFQTLLRPVLIGFTIMVMVVFAFLFTHNPGVAYAGYIENVSGLVEILDPSTGTWSVVSQGQSLPVNTTIRTLSDSQVTIAFPGGERSTLTSGSEIQLESIVKTQEQWEISLEMISGQSENLTASSTSSFIIKTNAGVVNSNKAHFSITVEVDGSVTTDVFEGDVKTLSHSERSTLHTGQSLVFPSNKYTTMGTPYYRDTNTTASMTPELMDKVTKTPNKNGNPSHTPVPKNDPTHNNNSENSSNYEITCSPGNSNNNGNSENANNSENACK